MNKLEKFVNALKKAGLKESEIIKVLEQEKESLGLSEEDIAKARDLIAKTPPTPTQQVPTQTTSKTQFSPSVEEIEKIVAYFLWQMFLRGSSRRN